MATIVMDMSGNNIERATEREDEYGEEVMNAGWNPQLGLASELPSALNAGHSELPQGLTEIDIEVFLHKMYELQS